MTHHHSHDHSHHDELPDVETMFSQEFWDDRYRSKESLWSGNPNQRLVENVTGLPPGDALDIGCGEGADAIWLAQQGFRVTAVDLSEVALDRARRHAEAAGTEVAGRITWEQQDVQTWQPEPSAYDLVSQQFLHLLPKVRRSQHEAFAASVRPGGVLLIVGHHPSDLDTTMGRPRHAELMFTAEEEAAELDPSRWEISAGAPTREATDPDGHPVTIADAVLKAVRRS